MAIKEKVKKLNNVMTDINLTIAERQAYVETLTENEMRGIIKELMTTCASRDNFK